MRTVTLLQILFLFPGLLFAGVYVVSPVKQKNVACDYLIITVDSLKATAQKLAEYRAVNQNDDVLLPKIITMEDIEKEFTESDVTRDKIVWNALHYIYANWQKPFKYLVLLGDDSLYFNPKDSTFHSVGKIPSHVETLPFIIRLPEDLSLRGENTFQPQADLSDDWYYSIDQDTMPLNSDYIHTAPVSIGRILCESNIHLSNYIEKLKTYEETYLPSPACNKIIFLADDAFQGVGFPDPIQHHGSTDVVSNAYQKGFFTNKFYLSEFLPDGANSGDQICKNTGDSLIDRFKKGYGAFCFFGHGAPHALTDEYILQVSDAPRLSQIQQPMQFQLFTCKGARIITPFAQSMAKQFLFSKTGGAISYLGSNNTAYAPQNEEFAHALVNTFNTTPLFSIGEQLSVTKKAGWILSTPNFLLLGDPAIPLMQPTNTILLSVDNGLKSKVTATVAYDAKGPWKFTAETAILDSVCVSQKQGGWWFVKRRVISEITDSGNTSLTVTLPDSLFGKRVQISFYVSNGLKCARNDTIVTPGTTGLVSPVGKTGSSLPTIILSAKTVQISVTGKNEYLSKVTFFSLRGQKMFETNLGNKTACAIPLKSIAISNGLYIARVVTNKSVLSQPLMLQQ